MFNKKSWIVWTLSLLIVFMFASSVSAQNKVSVKTDGTFLEFDVPPVNKDGRVLVPLRGIFEAFDISPEWDAKNRTVIANTDTAEIILPIDKKQAWLNGQSIELDVPATLVEGRTMVPARFIAESLGTNVGWNALSQIVLIHSPEGAIAYENNDLGFRLTIPQHWIELVETEASDDTVSFYSKDVRSIQGYEKVGWVFSINKTSDTPAIRQQIQDGHTPISLIQEDEGFLFVKYGPSDVQFPHQNETITELYFRLYDDVPLVIQSFQLLN